MLEITKESVANMRKVFIEIELTNGDDDALHRSGFVKASEIRRLKVSTLVDTSATGFSLPREAIQKLGLPLLKEVTAKYANGQTGTRKVFGSVLINVMGRSAVTWVVESPPNVPALLGQVPLEILDLMVDLRNQRLVPAHPESPDMALWEAY